MITPMITWDSLLKFISAISQGFEWVQMLPGTGPRHWDVGDPYRVVIATR
jgi:hypothetical protein